MGAIKNSIIGKANELKKPEDVRFALGEVAMGLNVMAKILDDLQHAAKRGDMQAVMFHAGQADMCDDFSAAVDYFGDIYDYVNKKVDEDERRAFGSKPINPCKYRALFHNIMVSRPEFEDNYNTIRIDDAYTFPPKTAPKKYDTFTIKKKVLEAAGVPDAVAAPMLKRKAGRPKKTDAPKEKKVLKKRGRPAKKAEPKVKK